jgi:branched-chain amino acid transport system permease protein
VAKNIMRSSVGRNFAAVRDQDIAAGVVGVNPFVVKTQAFVISSAMAGVAGALLGGYLRFVNLEQWGLHLSTQYLAMVVIGGIGVPAGAVLGAVFVTGLPEVINRSEGIFGFLSSDGATGLTAERLSAVIYGLLLTLVMVVEPQGLFGLWRRVHTYFTNWPFRSVK